MPTPNLSTAQRRHRFGHTLDNALEVVFDDWPELASDVTSRKIARHAGWALESLASGDRVLATQEREQVARMVALLPNGDTTPGAT